LKRQAPNGSDAGPSTRNPTTDCSHQHSISLGSYKLDKPEDVAVFKKLFDANKDEWRVTVQVYLCADCNRNHAHMVMDL